MKITFSARHFEATDKLKEFAKKELLRLKKYTDAASSGEIILDESKSQKIVDIRVTAFGKTLVSKMDGTDFYKVIPKVVSKLETQVRSIKSKVTTRG
ncbi:MAG: ribosome-associated translation inhibitor RaiA [Calditrichaeota bacterium]|jgi:putative sigma-54 modulation protein|nr:ribosome-associated translation inhibitor RaiA [Calditrichota bacterium]MBT7617155.1 ribosome-associated translation inhibitor RaiA [Calditrichota bacterium]MBT7787927.1 ribosome-associated translation inhibitor RaiA [Calditrichota bacterium]